MERLLDKMVSADFVRHVTPDLNRPLDQQLSAEEVRMRWEDLAEDGRTGELEDGMT